MNEQNTPEDEVSWAVAQLSAEPLYFAYGVATSCSAFFPPLHTYTSAKTEADRNGTCVNVHISYAYMRACVVVVHVPPKKSSRLECPSFFPWSSWLAVRAKSCQSRRDCDTRFFVIR